MVVKSLLDIRLEELLEKIERKANVKLPRKVIKASFSDGVLHARFTYPKEGGVGVEPLLLKTPIYLFGDEGAGEITALEILNVDEALAELKGDKT